MYKIKVTGNYNVIVNDLSLVFAHNRPERMISDEDFEKSEDIKKYLGQFLEAEHVNVKVPKKQTSSEKKQEKKNPVKTKIEDVDGKDRVIIENKEHPKTDDIIRTEDVIEKAKDEVKKDDDIIVADGASSEKNVITEEEKNGVRVDNNGNVVQNIQPKVETVKEAPKAENTESAKEEQKEEKPKKKNKGSKKTNDNGVEHK